jgi:hypothetical protein
LQGPVSKQQLCYTGPNNERTTYLILWAANTFCACPSFHVPARSLLDGLRKSRFTTGPKRPEPFVAHSRSHLRSPRFPPCPLQVSRSRRRLGVGAQGNAVRQAVAALRAAGSEVSSQSSLSATKAEVSKHVALGANRGAMWVTFCSTTHSLAH